MAEFFLFPTKKGTKWGIILGTFSGIFQNEIDIKLFLGQALGEASIPYQRCTRGFRTVTLLIGHHALCLRRRLLRGKELKALQAYASY